jgi:hypothetical protein
MRSKGKNEMKLLLTGSFTVLMCLAPAFGQNPAPAQQNPAPAQKDGPRDIPAAAKGTEVTGCLSKTGDSYTLSAASGGKVQVQGLATQLDQYANQEVKITGEQATKDGKPSFTATKVETVSATCITKS